MLDKKLSDQEIYTCILELVTAEKYTEISNDAGQLQVYLFLYPAASVRNYANFLEKKALKESLALGLFSEQEVTDEFKDQFFSTSSTEELIDLDKKIQAYTILLEKRVKGSARYEEDVLRLKQLQDRKAYLVLLRDSYKQFSAEYRAREIRNFYLLSESTYTIDRSRLWTSAEDLLEHCSIDFAYRLLNEFTDFYWGPDISVTRQIARSSQWRNMYLAASKTGSNLFTHSVQEYTVPQQQLVSWTMQYDMIYELPFSERPSEDIIENDEAFDKFMTDYVRKIRAESYKTQKAFSKKDLRKKPGLSGDEHEIVTAEASSYIDLHKNNMYSDPGVISSRAKNEGSSVYNESKEIMDANRKLRAQRLGKLPENQLK